MRKSQRSRTETESSGHRLKAAWLSVLRIPPRSILLNRFLDKTERMVPLSTGNKGGEIR